MWCGSRGALRFAADNYCQVNRDNRVKCINFLSVTHTHTEREHPLLTQLPDLPFNIICYSISASCWSQHRSIVF